MSMVKLLIAEREERRGFMCSSRADSMAHVDGTAVCVKREKVRW